MSAPDRSELSVPHWAACVILFTWGIGWLWLASALTRLYEIPAASGTEFALRVLSEFAKAVLIGSSAGVILRKLLPGAERTEGRPSMDRCGISHLYPKRTEALDEFLGAIEDPRTRSIRVAGISLRDFFRDDGSLRDVWSAILTRMLREDQQRLPVDKRLRVHLLLLDPLSQEGLLRSTVEAPFLMPGLAMDVPTAIRRVQEFGTRLSEEARPLIAVRLYSSGSFGFQFITESAAVVEQYSYRNQSKDPAIPAIRYPSQTAAYDQIVDSYSVAWEHSREPYDLNGTHVGLAAGIERSRLTNIYGDGERGKLGKREYGLLADAGAGDIIDIQSVSARFHFTASFNAIDRATASQGGGAKARVLLLNPVGRAAIMRAVADSAPLEEIGLRLQDWSWEDHQKSPLYRDVTSTINSIQAMRGSGHAIDVRLAVGDLPSSVLAARKSIFVEQYAYGRSQNYDRQKTLGGELPVFEYERVSDRPSVEQRTLQSAFEVLWDSYSAALDDQGAADGYGAKETFEREKQALLEMLRPSPPDSRLRVVILAAGYGTRICRDPRIGQKLSGKPKALFPLDGNGGRTILDAILDDLRPVASSLLDITIVTNDAFAADMEEWKRHAGLSGLPPVKVVSDGTGSADQRRGAVADLHFAVIREDLRDNVFVIGADNIFAEDFREFVDAFHDSASALIAVNDKHAKSAVAGKYGVVEVDAETGLVTGFDEKPEDPKTTVASALCYVLTDHEIRLLKRFVRECPSADDAGEFIRYLLDQKTVIRRHAFTDWHDIGTADDYLSFCRRSRGEHDGHSIVRRLTGGHAKTAH